MPRIENLNTLLLKKIYEYKKSVNATSQTSQGDPNL